MQRKKLMRKKHEKWEDNEKGKQQRTEMKESKGESEKIKDQWMINNEHKKVTEIEKT